ncbi:MAG: periplasmic heavy metal sensor [Alphaproteobacteria bacterium]|nr:periplasmic heavy metal sensor [Alphaproteobacteria bacterium]MCB9698413.1 periplasmic heavy metal sensor [Alphaproteobacteria bacterium]
MLWWLSVALASGSPMQGPPGMGGGPHQGPPDPSHMVDRAEEIGLPAATVDAMRQLVDQAEPGLEASRQECMAAHQALREAMDAGQREAAMAASSELAVAEEQARELRLGLELDLRSLLTPEQWDQLRPPRPPRGEGSDGERRRPPPR